MSIPTAGIMYMVSAVMSNHAKAVREIREDERARIRQQIENAKRLEAIEKLLENK